MKILTKSALMAAGAAFLLIGAPRVAAQPGPGNFDPQQMRQRMMDRYREVLEVKGDDEWKAISGLVEKVMTARRDAGGFGAGMAGMFGRRGGGGGQGGGGQGDQPQRAPRPGFEPSAAVQELQKALEAKAPNDEIKAKLGKVAEERKAKEAILEKEQEALRGVLSVRQEALAVVNGLLPPKTK